MPEFEVIDCHVHPFVAADANVAFFPGTGSPDEFVREMKRAGIARCCGSVIKRMVNPSFEQIRALKQRKQ